MSATVIASSVVIGNLIYLGGAIVVMILVTLLIVLRQRKPKSVEANMESFNRGLRALAPSPAPPRRQAPPPEAARSEVRRRTVQTIAEPDGGVPTTET